MNMSTDPQVRFHDTQVGVCEPVSSVSQTLSSSNVPDEQLTLPDHVQILLDESQDLLTPEEQVMAEVLLAEFARDFAKCKDDLTQTSIVHHGMTMVSNARVKLGPRRLALGKRQALKHELKRLLKLGVIEPSKSSWASPVVLVTKKDGSMRLCIDYCKVNEITLKDSYPLPSIDDSINALGGSKWFSTLDLASGYWQVPMHPDDIEKMALTTPFGLYHFKVMPFGLANASATFERMMELVLSGLHWEICLIYIDDVIVFGRTFEEHIVRQHQVLTHKKGANLKLWPGKCKLFRHEVEYLGHVVSQDGAKTDPKKIKAIIEWPTPHNAKEVRSFVGLCSYYRSFVRGFTDITSPLHQIVAQEEFHWSEECEKAFKTLQRALTTPRLLAYPADDGIFILDTDASGQGLGAVLSQLQGGEEHVIAYYSHVLTWPEQQYCVTRRELLAVVEAIKHFHHYLCGRHFVVRTDHGLLKWLMNFKHPEGQTWRWLQVLSEYDFEIHHKPGSQHKNADGLSRRPSQDCRVCERQERKDAVVDTGCPVNRIGSLNLETSGGPIEWCDPWTSDQIKWRPGHS